MYMNKIYAVYDMKDNEQCIGIFNTRKEVADYFNTNANTIGTTITKKYKRDNRYIIEKISL